MSSKWYVAWHPDGMTNDPRYAGVLRQKNDSGLAEWATRAWTHFQCEPHIKEIDQWPESLGPINERHLTAAEVATLVDNLSDWPTIPTLALRFACARIGVQLLRDPRYALPPEHTDFSPLRPNGWPEDQWQDYLRRWDYSQLIAATNKAILSADPTGPTEEQWITIEAAIRAEHAARIELARRIYAEEVTRHFVGGFTGELEALMYAVDREHEHRATMEKLGADPGPGVAALISMDPDELQARYAKWKARQNGKWHPAYVG